MLKVFALFLLSSNLFAQHLAYPDVRAKPDYKDTLTHTIIVYEHPESIIIDVVKKDKFLEKRVNWEEATKVITETLYVGPATVNEEYHKYVELIKVQIISH